MNPETITAEEVLNTIQKEAWAITKRLEDMVNRLFSICTPNTDMAIVIKAMSLTIILRMALQILDNLDNILEDVDNFAGCLTIEDEE